MTSAASGPGRDGLVRLVIAVLVLAGRGAGPAAAQTTGPQGGGMAAAPARPSRPATAPARVVGEPPGSAARSSRASLPPAIEEARMPPSAGGGMGDGGLAGPLVPGQVIQPIDLASVLRLAGARDLEIATARQRVLQSLGDLDQARGLWLPSLFTGPTYYRLDGQVQAINGQVQTVDRGSLFLGTTASLANSFPAAPPGSGFPPLNTLSGVLRISDAIYGTRAARRVIAANQAGVDVATNNALLASAQAYFDLQQAAGTLAIAREAAGHAGVLAGITGTYARSGAGLEADHRRILTELRSRRAAIRATVGRLEVASAELVRVLVLDPHLVVAPVEPAESVIRLIADEAPLDELVCQGWLNRPELAQAKELVQAAVFRLKEAKLRPFVPSVALSYSGGGFGGGTGSFFGNFSTRGDFAASLFWELRGLGLADRGYIRSAEAQRRTADINVVRVQAQVAADVVASYKARAAAAEQMVEMRQSVIEAVQSLELNVANIRRGAGLPGATRPIEVLQPIQALAQARTEYLLAVLAYNRAQFRLDWALGRPPVGAPPPATPPHPVPSRRSPAPVVTGR
jgi:outer membrane protein TolC